MPRSSMPLFRDVATIYSKRLCTACANRKRAEAIREARVDESRTDAEKVGHAASLYEEQVTTISEASSKGAIEAASPTAEPEQSVTDGQISCTSTAVEDATHS